MPIRPVIALTIVSAAAVAHADPASVFALPDVTREAPQLRGSYDWPPPGALIGFSDDFSSLAPLPAELEGQESVITDFFGVEEWGTNPFLDADPPVLGGGIDPSPNGTQAISLVTLGKFPSNPSVAAKNGWTHRGMAPTAGAPVLIAVDVYTTSSAESYEFNPGFMTQNVFVGRYLWGGSNDFNGPTPGLPPGPLQGMYGLTAAIPGGLWDVVTTHEPFTYLEEAPAGLSVGDPAAPPVGAWFRLIYEGRADGTRRMHLDFLDGQGPYLIGVQGPLVTDQVDGMWLLRTYKEEGAAAYFDNLSVSGPAWDQPLPPPLECDYFDGLEWMRPGEFWNTVQERWIDAFTTWGFDLVDAAPLGGEGLALRIDPQGNVNTGQYTEYARTLVPQVTATPGEPWRLCATVRQDTEYGAKSLRLFSSGAPGFNNETARILLGIEENPGELPRMFTPRIFVQTNVAFTPIDPGSGGIPIVGVDVADTGVDVPYGRFFEVCVEVDSDRNMTVSLDGAPIYEGESFARSVEALVFEIEHGLSSADTPALWIDQITLECNAVCPADTSGDGLVDFTDLNAVLTDFGQTTPGSDADVNLDGVVDFSDLNAILAAFGSCD